MNAQWKDFLQSNGADFAEVDDRVYPQLLSFGKPESALHLAAQASLLSAPSERGVIQISGEDAESFLQNQLTNDVRKLADGTQHQASAWCSPKGRMIASFRLFKRDDAYYLALARDLIEAVIKRLRMYVMMSKVDIQDLSDSMVHFSYAAVNADALISAYTGQAFGTDSDELQRLQHQSLSLLRYPANSKQQIRFDVFGDVADAQALWEHCQTEALSVNDAGQTYLNIIAGQPEICAASSEDWIPQMVNYVQVGGVDFQKGCYPGQEVVARLNYLGKTKRRLYRLRIGTDTKPPVGASISTAADSQAGKILSAVLTDVGTVEALAVLKIAAAGEALSLARHDENAEADNDTEAAITLLDLPYHVDDE